MMATMRDLIDEFGSCRGELDSPEWEERGRRLALALVQTGPVVTDSEIWDGSYDPDGSWAVNSRIPDPGGDRWPRQFDELPPASGVPVPRIPWRDRLGL